MKQLMKSLGVGGIASIASVVSLMVLMEWAVVPNAIASFASLLVGSAIQFSGNRQWVFRSSGSVLFQMPAFALMEAAAMGMNVGGFTVLTQTFHIPYLLAHLLCVSSVFWLFSYPLWRRLFRSE
jgi:putative flippase GtrA